MGREINLIPVEPEKVEDATGNTANEVKRDIYHNDAIDYIIECIENKHELPVDIVNKCLKGCGYYGNIIAIDKNYFIYNFDGWVAVDYFAFFIHSENLDQKSIDRLREQFPNMPVQYNDVLLFGNRLITTLGIHK